LKPVSYAIDVVETPRLRGERLRPHHRELLAAMGRDPEVMRTLGGVRSEEEEASNFAWNEEQWRDHGHGLWIFTDKSSGQFAGRAGIRMIEVENVLEPEVGYTLSPKFWGQGLATEMARECVRVGFTVLSYPSLFSMTWTENKASERVMQKAGFVFEKKFERAGLPHVGYRLTRERWTLTELRR
jgi:RimJ/RimL family protein N-acetyltransferase